MSSAVFFSRMKWVRIRVGTGQWYGCYGMRESCAPLAWKITEHSHEKHIFESGIRWVLDIFQRVHPPEMFFWCFWGPSFDCLRCFGQHLIVMMWQQHVKIIGVLEEAGDSNPHDVYQELNTYTAAYVYIETYYTDICMRLYVQNYISFALPMTYCPSGKFHALPYQWMGCLASNWSGTTD